MDDRDRLRVVGQHDLGAWIEVAENRELWSIQRTVAQAVSQPRARVAVPSCNASGKTFLAARLALAFYDAYTPGAPCEVCDPWGEKGGCRGSKVILTSSKETHLYDNLGGELRMALGNIANNEIELPGGLPPRELMFYDSPDHFIRGQVATKEEGFQGYHAAHKLIIGDEATSVSEDVARGITSLMATADTRLLLIFNPTTPDTYAAMMSESPRFETIRITAFDTPHFTGEHVPEGSNLVTPAFLEDLEAQGMGPGSYEWTTRVLAEFWSQGEATLIPPAWVRRAQDGTPTLEAMTALGVDLSSYGTDESVIIARRGNTVEEVSAHKAGPVYEFVFNGNPRAPVAQMVMRYQPWLIIFDADGVGAGAVGEFVRLHEWALREGHMARGSQVIGFRGGKKIDDRYLNARSAWWWALRRRFERQDIVLKVVDQTLNKQLSQIQYAITESGAIKIESKDAMKRRGLNSPDRADGVMYAFAFSEEIPDPDPSTSAWVVDSGLVTDDSDKAHWRRVTANLNRGDRLFINAVTGLPDEL